MDKEICRAITFVNYHIPMTGVSGNIEFTTLGFFDGMHTEPLNLKYEERGLDELWRYTIRCTATSGGRHSYQNIFCFSNDAWNDWTDEEFWMQEQEGDEKQYPLTFVVFLQLQQYMYEKQGLRDQCISFKRTAKKIITRDQGKVYVYTTIDKNDFVVCIRCKKYGEAVKAIKELHKVEEQIVYSYSVVSVHNDVLNRLTEEGNLGFLYDEILPSICLKGTVNSYDPTGEVDLELKYVEFYDRFVKKMYDPQLQKDSRIYDILGDADFRLIARKIKLGKLLKEYADGGLLSYKGKEYKSYFFSTSLILNTNAEFSLAKNSRLDLDGISGQMVKDFTAPFCTKLEEELEHIKSVVENGNGNEKIITICYAVWQLLQSLKAMETAPTKAYDFKSLYDPLASLILVLEKKLGFDNPDDIVQLGENYEIFEYIHKVSMTLHSTLRTDIQFFQIRDFNAIVHYSPAKLRAFYAFWTTRLMEFYNSLSNDQRKYSFAVAPGMFLGTRVEQMFPNETGEAIRLMLITVPERHLYSPKWLSLILAHEISHFVGKDVRKREKRHLIWRECCARIFVLEKNHYCYERINPEYREYFLLTMSTSEYLLMNLRDALGAVDKDTPGKDYHSRKSIDAITNAFQAISGDQLETYVVNECCELFRVMKEKISERKKHRNNSELILALGRERNKLQDEILLLYQRFQTDVVSWLELLNYITSEAYADMIAIMTLKITPGQYIASYSKTELNGDILQGNISNLDMILPYKIALVLKTISTILCDDSMGNQDLWGDIKEEWTKEKLIALPETYLEGALEEKIALKVWHIQNSIRDLCEHTEKYETSFNYDTYYFDGINAGFLLDKMIWDKLSEYLSECMGYYAKKLREVEIKKKYKEILLTYKRISGKSFLDMTQEIETFLYTTSKFPDQ